MKTQKFRFKQSEIGVFKKTPDDAVSKIEQGHAVMGMTMGDFSLIDLIHSILQKVGPAHVKIATWSAGIKDAHQVKWMIDSGLLKSICLLTDHSYVNRQKKYAMTIEELFGKENIRCSEMHAKFVLIENDDWKITIISSMNLNANRTCETFAIHALDDVFDFHNEFVQHHFDNMQDGFEGSSEIVTKNLNRYFSEKQGEQMQKTKHWSEL